ncbi:S2P metalloprotease [Acidianus sulfidivorans JP7]|uniref:S2P metalloprotease n=1 Tax=Acidianus sulfidivorans JP7 TaxID=619593 RepID=A0A2U9IM89_9CREN|nr:site-2 protease family protein [Acidianus sulfidivorans]AWR97130.1 S2P metalloprotease [Acidianus sulfidivorans JP7]
MNIGLEVFLIGFVIFWLLLFLFRKQLEKKGFNIYPLFLMWRKSTRAQWFPNFSTSNFYRKFENVAIALGIISMLGGIILIYYTLTGLIFHPSSTTARLEPIIPGVTVSISYLPYILLALGISVTLHELAHALSSTSNKINVRNGGFILIGIFPGAFVEPDEQEFMNSSFTSKIKIIAAGIAVNLILAGIFFPLATYLPPFLSQGILVEGVIPHSAAYNSSISAGDIILSINGIKTTTFSQLSYALNKATNYTIMLRTPNDSIFLTHAYSASHFLGVYVTYAFPSYLLPFLEFFTWMFIINFSLALLNGAPLVITDGGKIFTEILKKINLKYGEKISYALQALFLMSLIYAVMLSVST